MKVDVIIFEYQLSEFRLNDKTRKTCETEQNKNNSHIAEWLKSVNNTKLVPIQCNIGYFFLFCNLHIIFPLNFVKIFWLTIEGTLSISQRQRRRR